MSKEDVKNTDFLTMSQASQILGVSTKALRKYCNNGVVPNLRYTTGRHRVFTNEQIDWLRTMIGLGRAGFTVKDLRKYTELMQKGEIQERLAMVRTHKRQVWQALEDLQATIDFLERQEELLTES